MERLAQPTGERWAGFIEGKRRKRTPGGGRLPGGDIGAGPIG